MWLFGTDYLLFVLLVSIAVRLPDPTPTIGFAPPFPFAPPWRFAYDEGLTKARRWARYRKPHNKLIREIYPNLLIGTAMDARDLQRLYDYRIAAVVDLAINEPPAQVARDMIYCRIPIIDGDGNANGTIETAVRCVIMLVTNDFRTLVACSAGMSRSPAIAAAAIAIITQRPLDECLATLAKDSPHDVSPVLWGCVKTVYNRIVPSGD